MSGTRVLAALLPLGLVAAGVSACDLGPFHGSDLSTLHLTDPVGDVHPRPAGDEPVRNADLTGAVISRTGHGLRVQLRYRDLSARQQWAASYEVVTSDSHDLTYLASWESGQYADTHRWYRSFSVDAAGSEDGFGGPCSGSNAHQHQATATVDYRADTLTLVIPDRCLGGAASWLRVDELDASAEMSTATGNATYHDNPFNTGRVPESTPHLVAPS